MKFYAYKGNKPLGKEPCGGDGKTLFELKTKAGAIRRLQRFGWTEFKLYSYTNFYDDKTFKEIK